MSSNSLSHIFLCAHQPSQPPPSFIRLPLLARDGTIDGKVFALNISRCNPQLRVQGLGLGDCSILEVAVRGGPRNLAKVVNGYDACSHGLGVSGFTVHSLWFRFLDVGGGASYDVFVKYTVQCVVCRV